jgi:hypothetical protein
MTSFQLVDLGKCLTRPTGSAGGPPGTNEKHYTPEGTNRCAIIGALGDCAKPRCRLVISGLPTIRPESFEMCCAPMEGKPGLPHNYD